MGKASLPSATLMEAFVAHRLPTPFIPAFISFHFLPSIRTVGLGATFALRKCALVGKSFWRGKGIINKGRQNLGNIKVESNLGSKDFF